MTLLLRIYRCSYPELNAVSSSLEIELRMFRHQYKYTSAIESIQITRNLQPAIQDLLPVLMEYMKLLLVNPASSATAERRFNSLRRLKTRLRNSMMAMGQTRLNSCAACSAHVDALDEIDILKLAQDFISRVDLRENLFGKFPVCLHDTVGDIDTADLSLAYSFRA